jgi:hypothetical protein
VRDIRDEGFLCLIRLAQILGHGVESLAKAVKL